MEISNGSQNTGSNSGKSASYKNLPTLGYINIGMRVPSNDGQSSYQLSPFIGIEVKEEPFKNKLNKQEKELYAAIVQKIKGLEKGKPHKLNLEVEVFVCDDEESAPAIDASKFLDLL